MNSMAAWALASLDGPAALVATHMARPAPGPGQVAIAVEAVGLGHVDWLIARGGYQLVPPLPHVPGTEIAGRITAVGHGVAGLAVGDHVAALGSRAMAEAALAPAALVAVRPPGKTVWQPGDT